MSQFKYEKLILDTAKALQCFIEEYKRDRPKFLNNNNNNNNNQQQPQIGELTEDKVKLITTYALLNLTNVNNQKDFNLAVERYLNDLRTSEDGKTYVRYNNTWKEVNFNSFQGRPGRDGYTPYIQNGKWFLNNVDLGVNATGESAYDIAKRLNKPNTDTESNWINSLKGDTGAVGQKGEKGDKGTGISSITLSNETDKTYLNINLEDNTNSKLLLPLLKGDKGEPGRDVDPAVINRINTELSNKVDKVDGKQLSTNDFTTAEKQKLESIDLSTKLDKGTYSGTAKDLNDKIEQILTLLRSNNVNLDTLQEIVDYITLNRSKLEALGISNIAGLTQALSDKAPLNHNHDDRYMLKEHKPTWNDIQNKPDNLANSGNIQDLQRKIDQVNSVLSQKASTNHTHNWNDIQSKPSINKSGNVYTIPGIGGNIEIPSWVGSNKPVYNWGDIQNKPELNYLPLTGGTVTGNINLNGSLLINDKTRVEVRNNGNIVFGNKPFNDLVIGEFKGIQLWGQGNDKVVLAGGEVTNLSELKNENVKVGGRNYVLKSKEKQTSVGYIGKYWTLSEPAIVGIQYTFSCYASVEDGRQLCVYFTDIDGKRRQYIITDLVNGYNEFTIIPNYAWTGLCAFHEVSGVSPAPTATIEKLKFEKGNKATDWTPAPEDLIAEKTWEKQQHSLYGESLVTTLPSVQREVVIDNNSNSKNNLWTADNELNVGSRNVGGYAKINCNGYKLTGKDDNFVLTAGGGAKNLSDFDFYKGSIEPNDLNVFQSRKTGVYVVKYPVGWGTLVNFKSGGSTSSIEFLKRNWYAWSRIGVRNSVDDARFNEDNGEFCDLAWYSDVYRPGIIRYNWDATKEHQNDTVFVSQSGYIELNQLENLSSMSFRKVFSNGNVEFRCSGKQIIYTGDNQFNGKDGSTAVVSIYENKCYIDIRNI